MLVIIIHGLDFQAGWLGHDMTHARNSDYCDTALGAVSGFINGFNRDWWSAKHNTHHVLTNHIGEDPDIDLMPALYLMPPNSAADNHLRKYQHLYAWPLYSLLFISWRQQSLWRAVIDKDYSMLVTKLIPGYIWLLCMPWLVSIGAILLSGFLVGIVVTQTHESEEYVPAGAGPGSYVLEQFQSTRDIDCPDPVSEYLFGGMQYQLTHHLFPTLPRYKNAKLQKVVMEWAKENNLVYKHTGLRECYTDHYNMLKANAEAQQNDQPESKWYWPEGGWSISIQEQWASKTFPSSPTKCTPNKHVNKTSERYAHAGAPERNTAINCSLQKLKAEPLSQRDFVFTLHLLNTSLLPSHFK